MMNALSVEGKVCHRGSLLVSSGCFSTHKVENCIGGLKREREMQTRLKIFEKRKSPRKSFDRLHKLSARFDSF